VAARSDPLYDRAVEVVLKNQKASISLVQRHLAIGYNKAANLLESHGEGWAGERHEFARAA
jgi:S-DNA-T family DNA segregation ATPase FtsK/SpoIIIE